MALVRVDFSDTQPEGFGERISSVLDSCMNEVLSVPANENFVICQSHPEHAIWYVPSTCSAQRRAQIVFIQITLNQGRSPELKRVFFEKLNQALVAATELRSEDIFINIVEVARENWSFGIGHA